MTQVDQDASKIHLCLSHAPAKQHWQQPPERLPDYKAFFLKWHKEVENLQMQLVALLILVLEFAISVQDWCNETRPQTKESRMYARILKERV
jgi:hypothetical protein